MRDQVGFAASYRRHLGIEQRRAVLDAIRNEIDPDTTVGAIVDAALALGWGDGVGALTLSEFASILVETRLSVLGNGAGNGQAAQADLHAAARTHPRGIRPGRNGKSSKNGVGSRHLAASDESDDDDELDGERMSLDRAVDVLMPIVHQLGKVTMHELEERTGMGRRKLRFHVGQLVKHGHLARHGMGRGTYYTSP